MSTTLHVNIHRPYEAKADVPDDKNWRTIDFYNDDGIMVAVIFIDMKDGGRFCRSLVDAAKRVLEAQDGPGVSDSEEPTKEKATAGTVRARA